MDRQVQAEDMMAWLADMKNISMFSRTFRHGSVTMTICPILKGIYLVRIEISGSELPLEERYERIGMTTINWCISGRCEFHHSEKSLSYISPNMVCIGKKRRIRSFYYPLGYYSGFELYFIESLINPETERILSLFELDISALGNRFLKFSESFVGMADDALVAEFRELVSLLESGRLGAIRMKTLQIVQRIITDAPVVPITLHGLTREQALLARKTHDMLTADLSAHVPVREIANRLGSSETSLKNFFKEVYGSCISCYMNSLRMEYAAKLLRSTELSVSEISSSVGYANQGHFAELFHKFHGIRPLEYRKKKWCRWRTLPENC